MNEVPRRPRYIQGNPESIRSPFRIFIPGATGGGKLLTANRRYLHATYGPDVFAPSSLLSREGHKKGENLRRHFERLSQEIQERAGDKNLEFVVHSSGGHEVIDLLDRMVDSGNLNNRHVSVNFISTPGFIGKGLKNVIATGRNLQRMSKEVAILEQHMVYPLPETHYAKDALQSTPPKQRVEEIFTDSSQKRTDRRRTFMNNWLPQICKNPIERQQVNDNLTRIDQKISQAVEVGISPENFLRERAALLAPLIQDIFQSKYITEDVHHSFLEQYQETAHSLASLPRYYVNYLLYIARFARRIDKGMGQAVAKLINKGSLKGVDIKMQFTFLERDLMLPLEKLEDLNQTISSAGISNAVNGFYYAQQYAHSTVGYRPELLASIFEKQQTL